MIPHLDICIGAPNDVIRARRTAHQFLSNHFDESERGRVATIVTELASHLIEHGTGARLLIGCHASEQGAQVEILALDSGASSAHHAWKRSHAQTAEPSRLEKVRAMSTDFAVHSFEGRGTVILSRTWAPTTGDGGRRMTPTRFSHAGIALANPGNHRMQSAWRVDYDHSLARIMVIDPTANEDTLTCISKMFTEALSLPRSARREFLKEGWRRLNETGGTLKALVALDCACGAVDTFGEGDIAVRITTPVDARTQQAEGHVGERAPMSADSAQEWPRRSTVVLHSRGIRSDWSFEGCESILKCDPAIIAGWLIRDYAESDDAIVVVLKRH